ncbi:MAG: efflux RND transporter periplasmic adaptor subunit [Pseudomonadales bacterium]|jgi:RND family efflux transporter MFP subunit|nr:efflux RND transporter periplasmic adaptor subunit [Pseudomonadales bacterium]
MIRTIVIPSAIVIAFLFGAATLMATAPELEPSSIKPVPVTVRVQNVDMEAIQLKVHSQGSVVPSTVSQLIPEVSGRVTWTSPNLVAGGYFAAGQELARIDELDYKNARDRAKAALNRAKAEVEHARFEYGRLKSLAERKLTSRSALENGLRAYRVSQAAFEDATVSFEQAEENLNRTVLRAPFDGLVKSENVDIGQFAARGQAIATLYASDIVEVRLPIADRQLAFLNLPSLRTGNLPETQQPSVTLTAEYGGRTLNWEGKIVRTEAEIDTASRMVQLVARVETQADQPGLSVGLFVNAEISGIAVEDVVVLPRSSLRNENQVLIVDGENKIRFRTVTPLRLYQDSVLIADGLVEGDRVCVSTLQTAIEGMNVNPISENADARGV